MVLEYVNNITCDIQYFSLVYRPIGYFIFIVLPLLAHILKYDFDF